MAFRIFLVFGLLFSWLTLSFADDDSACSYARKAYRSDDIDTCQRYARKAYYDFENEDGSYYARKAYREDDLDECQRYAKRAYRNAC